MSSKLSSSSDSDLDTHLLTKETFDINDINLSENNILKKYVKSIIIEDFFTSNYRIRPQKYTDISLILHNGECVTL